MCIKRLKPPLKAIYNVVCIKRFKPPLKAMTCVLRDLNHAFYSYDVMCIKRFKPPFTAI